MRADPIAVPPEMSIHRFVEDYLYRYDFKVYPVVDRAHDLLGCISTADVTAVPGTSGTAAPSARSPNPAPPPTPSVPMPMP